jgi:hypothetical protein
MTNVSFSDVDVTDPVQFENTCPEPGLAVSV